MDSEPGAMDRITLEVIGAALLSAAEEMGQVLIRSSYSTNIKERQDCSTAVFDPRGEVIAQAEHIPMHLGSLIMIVQEVLKRYPLAGMRAGDLFIGNDPYTDDLYDLQGAVIGEAGTRILPNP